jgi:hypothetical protein
MTLLKGSASEDAVRLTTNTVEKRLELFRQQFEFDFGLKRGVVDTYSGTTRAGTATIDNKSYAFKAVNVTVTVGDVAVFQRLTNGDRGFILLGTII